jgi:acetolactate synthase I/II/III large subunit
VKISDLIAEWLASHVRHAFVVSGGANLHILHSIAHRKDITNVCTQSEQAAGFAADAYARLSGCGVAIATSGPGATNLITPLAASFYDSVPTVYITGNQTRERLQTYGTRQYGFQATPICQLVRDVTKMTVMVLHPSQAIPLLNEAYEAANSGRKGPVLIDFPDDVQRAEA